MSIVWTWCVFWFNLSSLEFFFSFVRFSLCLFIVSFLCKCVKFFFYFLVSFRWIVRKLCDVDCICGWLPMKSAYFCGFLFLFFRFVIHPFDSNLAFVSYILLEYTIQSRSQSVSSFDKNFSKTLITALNLLFVFISLSALMALLAGEYVWPLVIIQIMLVSHQIIKFFLQICPLWLTNLKIIEMKIYRFQVFKKAKWRCKYNYFYSSCCYYFSFHDSIFTVEFVFFNCVHLNIDSVNEFA